MLSLSDNVGCNLSRVFAKVSVELPPQRWS
jgi:hypothetical protein